jgi:tetratricopeptide (TPR) repeat protein
MMKNLVRVVVLSSAVLFIGCAPKLYVRVQQPAPTNLGAAKKVALVQMEGRRSAKEALVAELIAQAREAAYFQVTDRTEEGITVKVKGRTVDLTPPASAPQAADEVGMRVDVLDWTANKDSKTTKDSKGNEKTTTVYKGKVLLGVTSFNGKGKAQLAEKEFSGAVEGEDEEAAIKASAKAAVRALLAEVTPTYVEKAIRMDGDDETQKPIIEMAKNGDLAKAIAEGKAAIAKNPTSAPAAFNLAVMLDASGNYEEAMVSYDQALKLGAKDYYTDVRTECAKRAADAAALRDE